MGSAIAPVTNIVGGILGQAAAGPDRGHAAGLTDEALAEMRAVGIPQDLAEKIYYQQYQNAGQLNPEQEKVINAAPSVAGQVQGDKGLQSAQMEALTALKGISQTGMSATDKARLNQIQQQMATKAEGQRQAILQNFAQRGQGGSGNELIAQLQASQNAANQANQQGLDVASSAQQNALQALGQYGQQAGQMEGQKFNEQTQAGTAQDLLNRFNVQNQQGQQQRNVAGSNSAQQFNLQNEQNTMNANTNQTNQELLRQKNAQQQLFQDAMQKATGVAGADFSGAKSYNQMGDSKAAAWTQGAQGVGQLGSLFGGTNTQSPAIINPIGPTKENGTFAHGGMVQTFEHGGVVEHDCSSNPMMMALMNGGKVPGQAEVPGDSLKNDKVRALLSPGEIVIPRSITMHPDAPSLAKEFVNLELRKKHQR